MAPDVGPGLEAGRKTLEEIRREIDAEYPPVAAEPPLEAFPSQPRRPRRRSASFDTDEVSVRRRRPARSPHPSLRGYFVAAAIGCIVGQVLLVTYGVALRHAGNVITPVTADRSSPGPRVAAGGQIVGRTAGSLPAQPSPRTVVAPVIAHDERQTAPSPAPLVSSPAPPAPSPARVIDQPKAPPLLPRQVIAPPPAPAPRVPLPGPSDWVTAQAQLREALAAWLRASKGGGAEADRAYADAEVILSADDQTARTRVRETAGVHELVRELRWERRASGWAVVDETLIRAQ